MEIRNKVIDIGISVIAACGTVYMSFSQKLNKHETEIAVLKNQQATNCETTKRIEEKLDKLVDKLL